MISVQAFDTMNKLKEINGYVRLTLDKLTGIRTDSVRTDEDWQKWTFPQLVDALRKWTTRNPKIILSPEKGFKRENSYQTNDCKTVTDIEKRRLILSEKKLCFNCTGTKYRASECLSKRSCVKCKGKQHSSNNHHTVKYQ